MQPVTDTPDADETQALTGDGAEQPAPASNPPVAEPVSEQAAPPAVKLRVLVQAGQSLPGVGRMHAQHEYEIEDSPIARERIDAGLLKLIEPSA